MLEQGEAHPADVVNADGSSAFFLVCEHASRTIPHRLGTLGLGPDDLERHIAWDIGAASIARQMSQALDAPLVLQNYSRLVIDCNRPPETAQAMPVVSERTVIPGNENIDDAERASRISSIFQPFHETVSGLLDARAAAGIQSILITLHSFNRTYDGFARPWDVGAQYNRAPEFSKCINQLLGCDEALCIGDNQPYPVNDATHYTIPVHGEQRGIAHTMLEVCNDLLCDRDGQAMWAKRLVDVLEEARGLCGLIAKHERGGDRDYA